MKHKLLFQRLGMKGTDRGVMAHLLRDQSVAFVLSLKMQEKKKYYKFAWDI